MQKHITDKNFAAVFLTAAASAALLVASATALSAAKAGAPKDAETRVLISFDRPVGASERALVRSYGGKIKYSYSIVNAVAARMPESAVDGLKRNPRVTIIEADGDVRAVDMELDNSWGVRHIQSGAVHDGYGTASSTNKGAGVKIGIIDSGVNYYHADLNDNFDLLNPGYDFYYYDYDPMDVYGHGTHVAGTACAADNDNGVVGADGSPLYGVVGVAPACRLYSLRVLNEDGVGYWSDIIAALEWSTGAEVQIYNVFTGQWLAVQGEKMDVINLSLGKDRNPGETVKQAFDNAEAEGLVIVAAAGNSGNPKGRGNNTIYPANFDSVIAVAATDSSDNRAGFSSTGDAVELSAPGVDVYSSWNDDTPYYGESNCRGAVTDLNGDGYPEGECYKFGSGTSMASPHVAGAAALVIAAGVPDYNGDGFANNRDVRAILDDSTTDLGDAGRDAKFGYGLVNALKAAQMADGSINIAPFADAGADQTVIDSDGNGSEFVSLDGSGSYDPDGFIVLYEWYDGTTLIAAEASTTAEFSLGEHTVTLTVTDNEGTKASDSVKINVVENSSDGGGNVCPPGLAKKGKCSG